jgi:ribosomal protein S18 acetylase RimI-like enzyme
MNEILERVTVRLPENEAEFATLIAKEAEVFGDAEAFYDDLYIEIGKKNTLAAFIDGKMAGAVNFPEITYPTNEKTFIGGYIFAAWVAPEYRGNGVFSILMEKAEEEMRARGYDFALVVPANEDLFPMYEKFGYTNKVKNGFPYVAPREILREYNPTDDIYMLWKVYSKTHDTFMKDMELFNHTLRDAEESGKNFAIAKNGYIIYSPRYDGDITVYDRMNRGTLVDMGKRSIRALCKAFADDMPTENLVFNMMFEPKYEILKK